MQQELTGLVRRQLEAALSPWRSVARTEPPRRGWIQAIRQALGMSAPQLARRLRVTRQAVAALERRELDGTITLEALRRAAAAMDCDVVYAVVPRLPLEAMIRNRARQRAEEQLARLDHSMRLEAQGVAAEEHEHQMRDAVEGLLRKPRALWSE